MIKSNNPPLRRIDKRKFVLIDGNALIHRAFHALPPLTTKSGELVNAVFGFTSVLLKAIADLKPTHMAVAFDMKGPTFRHKMYKEYKATRVKAPQGLYDQIPRIKKLVEAFNIPIYERQGFEADDIIGTLSKKIKINNVIVTGDLDELQLVDDNTKVYTMKRGMQDTVIYNEEKVIERFGILPSQLIDYKGLRGDPSDNIPGVRGIGEKTASILLQKFGTIENLYKELKKSEKIASKPEGLKGISDRIRKLLLEQEDKARMSKELATIIIDMDLKIELKQCEVRDYDKNKVIELLRELEFRSLLSRLPESKSDTKQQSLFLEKNKNIEEKIDLEKYHYTLIDSEKKFSSLLDNLEKTKEFAIDTETTSIKPVEANLVGISFSIKGSSWYLPRNTVDQYEQLKERLQKILTDKKIKKIAQNGKYDLIVLKNYGMDLSDIDFDTMIASYILSSNSRGNNLDNLAFQELGHQMMSYNDLVGKGRDKKKIEEVNLEKLAYYSSEDADYTFQLKEIFSEKLKKEKKLEEVFEKIEMPLLNVLAYMEMAGVKIDSKFLKGLSEKFTKNLKDLEKKIYDQAGASNFNINSTQQLSKILFEKLKIPIKGIKKTTLGYSTAAPELAKLYGTHPIIPLIEEYREYTKLKNTYIDALPKLINKKTGRIHTSFNQTITSTGRLSSSDPNIQNIPIRTEIGREIRKAFIAESGFDLLSADYSQIELRLVAEMSQDKNLIKAFKNNEDIHRRTASLIFNKDIKDIDYDERRFAKTINFGVIYGMGSNALSRSLEISREEAKNFIDKYFKTFPSINEYIDRTLKFARENGYVKTEFGRRRYLPEIISNQPMLKAAAERMAVNMPLQGTAADIIKLAMTKIFEEFNLNRDNKDLRMILQVHDELVFEIKEEKLKECAARIQDIMENVYKLNIPLKVDLKYGDSWGEMEDLII
jgi:DNA polymerase-1